MFLEAEKAGWQHGLRQRTAEGMSRKKSKHAEGKVQLPPRRTPKVPCRSGYSNQEAPGPKRSNLWELLVKEDVKW